MQTFKIPPSKFKIIKVTILLKNRLKFWLQLVLVWTFAIIALQFFRHYGWASAEVGQFQPERTLEIRLSSLLGLIIGTLYFFIEILMDHKRFRKIPFTLWALLKSILHLCSVVILFFSAIFIYAKANSTDIERQLLLDLFFSESFVVTVVYFILISSVITLFLQLNQKMGQGILKNMLLGRYHHPREEKRIFLFIDMKASTTIAEKLGHVKFSLLIKDCFADITDAVIKHDAEIYQYVGDEVILCWKSKKGIRKNHCVKAFFSFQETLNDKAAYYQKNYGLQPFFKAGAHIGRTMVTEVGILKRELAYLGDVLNTAARIQGKCNELGQTLLISNKLKLVLSLEDEFDLLVYDNLHLTGKVETVKVVGVQKKTN